jgi:hypothetical protein
MKNYTIWFVITSVFLFSACTKVELGPPDSMRIDKITVSGYPLLRPDGSAWDDPLIGSSTPPDLTWSIIGPEEFNTTYYAGDVDGVTVYFEGDLPVYLTELEKSYTIRIWDLDDLDASDVGSDNDLMSAISFVPWESEADDNSTLIILEDNDLTIRLEVSFIRN